MIPQAWVAWFTAPIRAGLAEPVNAADGWHGVLMMIAAGGVLPFALLITRYWKIVPGQDWPRALDHPLWWRVHRLMGYGSAAGVLAGFAFVFHGMSVDAYLLHPHAWSGWLAGVMLLALLINGWLRGTMGGPGHRQRGTLVHLHELPGDHYDMTRRRRWFERTHKTLGYSLMAVFAISLFTGLWHVAAPRWALLLLAGWWLLLLSLAFRWERQGRVVDGYQAKWGPGMNHPGNRIPVLGWGSRRYTEAEFRRLGWARHADATVAITSAGCRPAPPAESGAPTRPLPDRSGADAPVRSPERPTV